VRKIAETLNVGASTIQRLGVGDRAINLARDHSEPLAHLLRLAGVRYEACSACAPTACGERSDFGTATPDSCCHQVSSANAESSRRLRDDLLDLIPCCPETPSASILARFRLNSQA
jgi:hypothetical protein